MGQLDVVGQLIASLGLGALIVFGYTFVLRQIEGVFWQICASSIVFTCGAVAAMTSAIELPNGYLFDARAVFIVLSASFGGPVVGVLVSVAVAAVRMSMGGEGMAAGLLGIAIAGCVGIGFSVFRPKVLTFGSLLLLGCLSTLNMLSALVAGTHEALALFRVVGGSLTLVDIVGTVLLGSALEAARRATSHLRDVEFNADRDPLTGLYNRRALTQLEVSIDRGASEGKQQSCIILFDIDRFKTVNDRYGHPRGDEVLIQVAKTITTRIRRSDIAVRYGGEEIAVILLSTSLEDGYRVAEQIRTTIEELQFSFEGQQFSITISAGVAGFLAGETRLATALDFADRALYRAKDAGRNRTEVLNAVSQMAVSATRDVAASESI